MKPLHSVIIGFVAGLILFVCIAAAPPPVSISGSLVWTNDPSSGFIYPVRPTNTLALISPSTYVLFVPDNGSSVGVGRNALSSMPINIVPRENTAIGDNALGSVQFGTLNVGLGPNTLAGDGNNNTLVGVQAGLGNGSSNNNLVAVGYETLFNLADQVHNITAIGYQSLFNDSSGVANTALGFKSGQTSSTGSSNTFLGYLADTSAGTGSNQISIGASATANGNNDVEIGTSSNNFNVQHGIPQTSFGLLIHSNILASIPTLSNGDTYYWSSNGVAYVICSSPSGTLTTNKLGP